MYTGVSFKVFAEKAGISSLLAQQVIDEIVRKTPEAIELIGRSFLSEEAKEKYIRILTQRRRLLIYTAKDK